jgi:NADP-dependent 3-hydroxy acid dehydrogenase YdfG
LLEPSAGSTAVANAGIGGGAGAPSSTHEDERRKMFATNLDGTSMFQAAARHMTERAEAGDVSPSV